MPLNLFLLIIHLIPRWWLYYCSFIFMLVSSLYLNCIYRIHNNFYLSIPWNEAQKSKYQPGKRMTKFYTIIGCLMRHEFGFGSYDPLVSISATQMKTLQAEKRGYIGSYRSNSYKTKTPAEGTTPPPPFCGKMHEKDRYKLFPLYWTSQNPGNLFLQATK